MCICQRLSWFCSFYVVLGSLSYSQSLMSFMLFRHGSLLRNDTRFSIYTFFINKEKILFEAFLISEIDGSIIKTFFYCSVNRNMVFPILLNRCLLLMMTWIPLRPSMTTFLLMMSPSTLQISLPPDLIRLNTAYLYELIGNLLPLDHNFIHPLRLKIGFDYPCTFDQLVIKNALLYYVLLCLYFVWTVHWMNQVLLGNLWEHRRVDLVTLGSKVVNIGAGCYLGEERVTWIIIIVAGAVR